MTAQRWFLSGSLGVLAIATSASKLLTAQTPTSPAAPSLQPPLVTFQASRFAAGTDSFALIMRGTVRGFMKTVRTIETGRARLVQDFVAAGIQYRLHRELTFDLATLMPTSHIMRESYQGIDIVTNLSTNQAANPAASSTRLKGTAQSRGESGVRSTLATVDVPVGVVDAEAVNTLIPTLDLTDGFRATVSTMVAFPGDVRPTIISVLGREKVTVPGGTFDTYRVTVERRDFDSLQLFVTIATPRRVVLIRDSNSDLRWAK